MTAFGIGTFALKNPGLKLVSLNGRSLTSDNINSPAWTLNPKLPLGEEVKLCDWKSAICNLFNSTKSLFDKSISDKSTSPNDNSSPISDVIGPVKNTSNLASLFVVPSDCVLSACFAAVLNSTKYGWLFCSE